MKVEEVMTRGVVTCRTDEDLGAAAALMWEHDCGSIPIVDSDLKLVGILTDRDVCMGAFTQGRTLRDLRTASSMARSVITCAASDSLDEVLRSMAEYKVRRVPVVDDERRLVGMISIGDVVRASQRAGSREKKGFAGAVLDTLATICEPRFERPQAALPSGKNSRPRSGKRKTKT